jgi:AraC family transcriptional regulator
MTKTNKHAGFLNESMKSVKSGTTRDLALTASAPQGARADTRTGITSFIRGSSNRVITSSGLEWEGVSLELHNVFPAERNDSIAADHLIALSTGHVWRGEVAVSRGRFVPHSYYAGAVNLFPAGPIPACRTFTPAKMIVCALDPAFVREVGVEVESTVTEFRGGIDLRDGSLRGLMTLLAVEAETGGLSGKLYAEHLAHALALRFLWLSGGAHIPGHSHSGKMPNRVLQRVLDRMKACLATDLGLNTLAAESGYSRSHFLRTFRAAMGCSPHRWLTRLRMDHAKTMLRRDSESLIDIALACGFSSHAHFSNTFRQIVGVTPSEYRRSHSSNMQKGYPLASPSYERSLLCE